MKEQDLIDQLEKDSKIGELRNDITNLLYAKGVIDKDKDGNFVYDDSDLTGFILIGKRVKFKCDECNEEHEATVGLDFVIGNQEDVAESIHDYLKVTCDQLMTRVLLGRIIDDVNRVKSKFGIDNEFAEELMNKLKDILGKK